MDASPKCNGTRSGVSMIRMSSVAASVADILECDGLPSLCYIAVELQAKIINTFLDGSEVKKRGQAAALQSKPLIKHHSHKPTLAHLQ